MEGPLSSQHKILSDIICDGVFVGGGGLVMLDLPDDPACFFGDDDTKNDGVVLGAGKTSGDRGGRPVRCGDRQGSWARIAPLATPNSA